MSRGIDPNPILFEVVDSYGKKIRTSRKYWTYILEVKHKEAKGKISVDLVKDCLKSPDKVERSKEETVLKFYKRWSNSDINTCAVVRHLNGDGFLITCYLSTKITYE